MNLEDTYFDERTQTEVPLSDVQKAYRDHVQRRMETVYKQVMGKRAYLGFRDKEISKAMAEGKPEALYKGFIPRIQLTWAEEMHNNPGTPMKTLRKEFSRRVNNLLDDNYASDSSSKSVPLRHYSDQNSDMILSESFSFDVEKAYKEFMKSLIMKDEMDPVYSYGEGLKGYLATTVNEKGQPQYKALVGFLDDQIVTQVLNSVKTTKLTRKNLSFYVNDKWAKTFGVTPGRKEITLDKVLHIFKSTTSVVGMGFKIVSGTFNGLMAGLLNTIKALQGSLAKRASVWSLGTMPNVAKEDIDFSLRDWMWSLGQ
jgi:hypothetical protein